MAIPKFTDDLSVISKLPDTPRDTNGYPADVLKKEFDKAGLAIQKFLNDKLIPAIAAGYVPFRASSAIPADNIQAAIENVQGQIKDAASGAIVNGSVTAEKLSAELLARTFGGRPWVCVDTPDSKDTPAAGFPVGQIWLRPQFTVNNLAGESWTGTGCTITADSGDKVVSGTNTVSTVYAAQSLTNLGNEGDRIFILFDVAEKDSEITSQKITINSEAVQDVEAENIFQTALLSGGSLSVSLETSWPSTSLAGGSFTIRNYAVVNIDQIMRQTTDAREVADWGDYLHGLLPISNYTSAAEVYMEVSDGMWWPIGFEVLPVSRGGTGLHSIPNGLIYGLSGAFRALTPGEDRAFLKMSGGFPVWQGEEDVIAALGMLRFATGTYTGNNVKRSIALGITPKVFFLSTGGTSAPMLFMNGTQHSGYKTEYTENGTETWHAYATLSGSNLSFTAEDKYYNMESDPYPFYYNESGKTYTWYAIY